MSLFAAARDGDLTEVRALLRAGARSGKPTWNGSTPLYIAARNGHDDVVRALLAEAAPPSLSASGVEGSTPLFAASEQGHAAVAALLLAAGADTEAAATSGRTPLYVAAKHGHAACTRLLLRAGADINRSAVPRAGSTPLYTASCRGHAAVVQALCVFGAGRRVRGANRSPREAAVERAALGLPGANEMVNFFDTTESFRNPLQYAEYMDEDDVRWWLATAVGSKRLRDFPAFPLQLAPGDSRSAGSLIRSAAVWSPEVHELFPPTSRANVLFVLMIGLRWISPSRTLILRLVLPFLICRD